MAEQQLDQEDVIFESEEESGSPASALKKLREKLKACEAEKQEYLTGWQRAKADFVNARALEARERDDFRKFAKESVLLDMISVADSFDMAFAHKESWEKVDAGWRVGVESIYSQLLSALERHGLTAFGAVGEPIDLHLHLPAGVVPTENEAEDDRVCGVIQKGYRLGDKVIRPAKVQVAHYRREA